jgi:hypothetical protein
MNGMRNTSVLIAVLLALTQSSCVTQKREGERIVPAHLYDLKISYSREERAFLLALTSHADNEICVPKMRWSDEGGGHYFYEDRRVNFVDRRIRYDIKDLPSGVCTSQKANGCVYILKKGDQLRGKLPIDDFSVPPDVVRDSDFHPQFNYPFELHFCANY